MYYTRYVEKQIERALRSSGAVLVAGPKFCGKTTTCMLFQKSVIRLNTRQSIRIAEMDPQNVLRGEFPRLIDEWQTVPDIWNQVKADLDLEYRFGKYILTGSATPADKTNIFHTGAGRIARVLMRPMSLYESLESSGTVSLRALFDGDGFPGVDLNEAFSLQDIAFLICRGGWPISLVEDRSQALDITRNYYNGLFVFEESENERFRNKRPEMMKTILRSYARHISSEASYRSMISDVRGNNERSLDQKTFDSYLEALRDIFLIEDLPAWNPNTRSKTSIRTTPTRHFTDTSIAARALEIMPEDLMRDLNTLGLFFEDLAVRDLSIYAACLGGELRHYRDNTGLECDAVIHLEDGRYAAVEIKLGGESLIEAGAASLLRLQRKLADKSDEAAPSFLMVLTAVGACYRRDDGVYVVPINMLCA